MRPPVVPLNIYGVSRASWGGGRNGAAQVLNFESPYIQQSSAFSFSYVSKGKCSDRGKIDVEFSSEI